MPVSQDADVLQPVLFALLRHCSRDGAHARSAAAALLRDLWSGLPCAAREPLFCHFSLRMLKSCPPLNAAERSVILEAIDQGCLGIEPRLLEQWCLDITAREAARCLARLDRPAPPGASITPATPILDVLRLVAKHAPAGAWPRLARALWLLYNLDTDPLNNRFRVRAGLAGSYGTVMRRSFERTYIHPDVCWSTAQRMLLRTLAEARPDDLREAAPGFFAWLEELARMPERELAPLLSAITAWPVPAMARVLEKWQEKPTLWQSFHGLEPHSPGFQRQVSLALSRIRAALGVSPDLVPASAPAGDGSEVSPAGASSHAGEETPTSERR